mmetsp:Transcript_6714/g.10790  ORF Transcript_6714/g.10790 Transcript_6714/m.10790 type:complete len:207 (+) Transcript_6714:1766-2386(+)
MSQQGRRMKKLISCRKTSLKRSKRLMSSISNSEVPRSASARSRSSTRLLRRTSKIPRTSSILRTRAGTKPRLSSQKKWRSPARCRTRCESRKNPLGGSKLSSKISRSASLTCRGSTRPWTRRSRVLNDSSSIRRSSSMKESVTSMRSLTARRRLERCGSKDLRRSRRSTVSPTRSFSSRRASTETSCWPRRMPRSNCRRPSDRTRY